MGAKKEVPTLVALPVELFLHICSFLPVRDLALGLAKVCRRFEDILSDENVWKCLIARRWSSRYPLISLENEGRDWKGTCLDIEKEWRLWKAKDANVKYVLASDVHISSVDAILFINSGSTCISASRDRSIVIWNPVERVGKIPIFLHKDSAHEGWIWRLHYSQNSLYSCSWDSAVKIWSLDDGDLRLKETFRCTSPVLSLDLFNGLIIAGDFGRTVYGFDPRYKSEPVFKYSAHRRAVLTLGSYKSEIISGSEDRTVAVWDEKTRTVRQTIPFGKGRFPTCSFMDEEGTMFIGDSKGSAHVVFSKHGNWKMTYNFNMGHRKPISVIKRGRGYLLTGSLDGTIKFALPTKPPQIITSIKTNRGEVGGLDYCNGILAVGASSHIEFWLPKEHVTY